MPTSTPTLVIIGCKTEAIAISEGIKTISEIVAIEARVDLGAALVRAHQPQLALLFLDHEPDAILELTRQLATQGQTVPIVVSASQSPEVILRAMRAGARDFAYLDPKQQDIARAVRDLSAAQSSPPPAVAQQPRGK